MTYSPIQYAALKLVKMKVSISVFKLSKEVIFVRMQPASPKPEMNSNIYSVHVLKNRPHSVARRFTNLQRMTLRIWISMYRGILRTLMRIQGFKIRVSSPRMASVIMFSWCLRMPMKVVHSCWGSIMMWPGSQRIWRPIMLRSWNPLMILKFHLEICYWDTMDSGLVQSL